MAKKSSAKAAGQAATTASTQRQPKKKIKKRQQVKKDPHGNVFVVLVQDVPHLGRQGEVVRVRPGYARNYLYPYGLAVPPTEENLRRLEQYKIQVQKAREAKIADLKVLAEQLSRLPVITIEANANEEGHLYGSIGPVEISKYLKLYYRCRLRWPARFSGTCCRFRAARRVQRRLLSSGRRWLFDTPHHTTDIA